ncbi:MAG TPA: hypothetical protein VFU05_01085 [Cyclobacteriaceae bacterium]|nr:hypothetical protein [Cyclobacteriaceae bacterium]
MSKFETTLKKYLDIFKDQEMYFVNDSRNLELFSKTPLNATQDDVRTKVSALNDSDVRALSLEEDMINHIVKLNIDDRIRRNDLKVVQEIAQISVQQKSHQLLHFASVYCNYHKPDVFPIYSEQYHDFYKKYIAEYKLPLDPGKLNTYAVFSQALNDLTQRLGLTGKLNYLQLRKFAWLYAETILHESRSNQAK